MLSRDRISEWWRRPPTAKDVSHAGILGFLGGFWISLLAAVFLLGQVNKFVPVNGFVPLLLGVIGAFVGWRIGRRWPKISKIVFLPFAFFGFTS